MKLIIIGGGVSGMIAAVTAAREPDCRVTVLERGRKPLRKLAVSGNGRGNLLNRNEWAYYGDTDFAENVLRHAGADEVSAFWQEIGVPLVEEEEGRVYPASLLAASAAEALLLRAKQLQVEILCSMRTDRIRKKTDGGFQITGVQLEYAPETFRKNGKLKPGALLSEKPFSMEADRVILAAGGVAAPQLGTDGTAYALAEMLGHTLIEPRPALSALLTDTASTAGMSGQRVRGKFILTDRNGHPLASSRGEALFTNDGVSGIAAMALARSVQPGCRLEMDLRECVAGMPELSAEQCALWLSERTANRSVQTVADWLVGACCPSLNAALLRIAGIADSLRCAAEMPISLIKEEHIRKMAESICAFTLSVTGVRGFENAQVTAGGIRCSEINPATLESRICPGMQLCGEILDVDGACGGYNLMFAAACGLLAGRAAVRNMNQ